MRGMLLAIETSQRTSSVAVGTLSLEAQPGHVLSESIDTSDRQKEDVLPAIERLCARAHVTREHLGALALNAGPGGFSGLRIAHAVAQVIAESWSIPIVQISAAVVARESAAVSGSIAVDQSVWVALAAKSGECWMAKVLNSRDGNDVPQQIGVRDLSDWPLQTAMR
jgi:tRNA threonylcarbamoyladenosine biosynthesis protein TsaB